MLKKCPECDLQVSDKALTCPHCGYPLAKNTRLSRTSTKKHRRLPNGFGSITEVTSQNLRKRFRARICVGKTETGRAILKNLKPEAYFSSYNEAYEALMNYNKNPYDLDSAMSVEELYNCWIAQYFSDISDAGKRTITSAWAYCSSVYTMRAKDIRARHIKGCMEDGFRIETRGIHKGEKKYASAGMKSRIKSMFNLMMDYALEYEIVDRNYARTFDISDDVTKEIETTKRNHIIFSDDEIKILWDNVNMPYVDWIIIQCYMGWRPQELATLKLSEINLELQYAQAGMKTEAGKQRIVPIHSKIKGLVESNYKHAVEIGSEYLLNDVGITHSSSMTMTYDKYSYRFTKVIESLGLNREHRPHDPRKTFITRCKKAEVDINALKQMVGHSIKDITESVYTVRDVEWLRKDLEKMQ